MSITADKIAKTGQGVKNLAIGAAVLVAGGIVAYAGYKGYKGVRAAVDAIGSGIDRVAGVAKEAAGKVQDQLGIIGIGAPRDNVQLELLRGHLALLEATLARELKNQEGFLFQGSNIQALRDQIAEVNARIAALTGEPYGTSESE